MKKEKNIILFVMNLPEGADTIKAVREYEKEFGGPLRMMLLVDSRVRNTRFLTETPGLDIYKSCDFSNPDKIAEVLLEYEDELLAVTCRSEKHIRRFMQVIPHVPYLRTPNTESLEWASDKYEMRKRLQTYDAKITPAFTWVKNNTKVERDRVVKKIGFPMIVKPANLAASLFVTICYHEEELDKTLRTIFRKIKKSLRNRKQQGLAKSGG